MPTSPTSHAGQLDTEWWSRRPETWKVTRVGRVTDVRNGFPFASEYFDRLRGTPLIRNRDIGMTETELFYDGPIPSDAWVDPGDVIVSMDGDFRVAPWRGRRSLLNQRMCAIQTRPGVDEAFVVHQIRLALKHIESLTPSTTVKHLSAGDIQRTKLLLPVLDEQRAIGRFLDEETAEIDALIDKNRRLLILIDEQRRRLVVEAVTKGVREHPERVGSGVAWIGELPRTWTVRRIKQVARLASGHTPSRSHPEYWLDAEIPWFQLTDIWRFRDDSAESISETAEMISEIGLRHSAAELLPAGTVALSRTASVGFSAILGVDMATTQDFANWVPGPLVNSAYLLYVLRAMRPELERLRFGSTHKTIYMPDIGQLVMPLPPLDEQEEIVSHIRAESHRLLRIRSRVQEAVEKLREYREALIMAAVTGQIDVSGAA